MWWWDIYWICLKGVKLLDGGMCCGFMGYLPALERGKIVVI
jgi:hypothetical protein